MLFMKISRYFSILEILRKTVALKKFEKNLQQKYLTNIYLFKVKYINIEIGVKFVQS